VNISSFYVTWFVYGNCCMRGWIRQVWYRGYEIPCSGVVANLELGERWKSSSLFFSSLSSPSLCHTVPSPLPLPYPFFPSFLHSLPLEVGPLELIRRKIIKIVATRCHVLKLTCTQFDFGWGSASDPTGEGTALPKPSCI